MTLGRRTIEIHPEREFPALAFERIPADKFRM